MNNLNLKQKVMVWVLGFSCLSSIFIMGLVLNALIYLVILFGVFALTNTIIEIMGKKNHAPTYRKIPAFIMCYFSSCFMLLMCIVVIKITVQSIPEWQAIILGIIIIAFSCFGVSGVFYWKPKNEPSKYQKEKDYIKYNPICPQLLVYENLLKSEDGQKYLVYKYLFKECITWDKAAELLDMETKRILPIADTVAFGLRVACKI